MDKDFDVCVIGSGAGGGPVALSLARAGYSVLILEKGAWFAEGDFFKDEIACCRRSIYTPNLRDERHVLEDSDGAGGWTAKSTYDTGRDFWNGNIVGGGTNFMSGYFHRLKPVDFKLLSTFGPIDGANVADWPITYEDLEPYYEMVEREVGVSGRVVAHPHLEPRSTPDYPFPPLLEHPISGWIDTACRDLGYHPLPVARAILSEPAMKRQNCAYTDYCGSYGCTTGAKGSARAALIDPAVATGNCEVRPGCMVSRLVSDAEGRVSTVEYIDADGTPRTVDARIVVVACQAIETARLLLRSTGPKHADGLGNGHGQVGRNLVFSAGGIGGGDFLFEGRDLGAIEDLKTRGLFVNRALQDWYTYRDPDSGRETKGGTIDFLLRHSNPIAKADGTKWADDGSLVWGKPLKRRLEQRFKGERRLKFEVFNDWLPTDDCFVSLDGSETDKWGLAVARVRLGYHPHDLKVGRFLSDRGADVLRRMGAANVSASVSGAPPPNLVAGGCRFGTDPKTSVLDPDCRTHDADNLFVTDGGFMPTGGSVPYTWTIYANAFRVAERIKEQLGGGRT